MVMDKKPDESLFRAIHILSYKEVVGEQLSIPDREGLATVCGFVSLVSECFDNLFVCHSDLVV
jgi:hypothetical protein